MAIRKIVTKEDPVLHSVCRPVEKFDAKLHELLDDMAETLYKAQAWGLPRRRSASAAGSR